MNKKSVILFIIVLLSVAIVVSILRQHSRLLLMIFPPSDLHSPVVTKQISINDVKTWKPFELKHNYVGTYLIGVYIKNPPPFGETIQSNASLGVRLKLEGREIFQKKFTRWASRFGGPGSKEAGVILGYYRVPDDIPLKDIVEATVSIENPDPLFESKFGQTTFFIKRGSDQ